MRTLKCLAALSLIMVFLAGCTQTATKSWRGQERWVADYGGVTAGTFPGPSR